MIENTVSIVTPLKGVVPERFDASSLYKALARGVEVAGCTPIKAPELLALFSTAFGDATTILSKIELQLLLSAEQIRKRRAVVVLDEMVGIVESKGHSTPKSPSGTAEIKEAVIDADEEMGRLRQCHLVLKCMETLWEGHRRKFEMDHGAVKKILERGMFDRNLSVNAPVDSAAVSYQSRSSTENQAEDPDF